MTAQRVFRTVCFAITLICASTSSAQTDGAEQFRALPWQEGPTTASLGGIAQIDVPEGFQFVGKPGAGKFMELMENPSDGQELGVLLNTESFWFVVFQFSERGYVKDDDRNLDANAILANIKEGTEAANKVRRDRGWSTMDIVGWHQAPFYDAGTNNLTWAIRGASDGDETINHATRLLGRRGVMNADLVVSPEQIGAALPEFNAMLGQFSFTAGNRYAEFTRGDKVAEYGLAGLIVGGAGVALVKTGLLQKFWKLIVFGLIALAGAVKRLFAGVARSRPDAQPNV